MDLTQVLEATASPGELTISCPYPTANDECRLVSPDTQLITQAQQQLEQAAQANLVCSYP